MSTGTMMGRPKKGARKPAEAKTVGVRVNADYAAWLDRLAKANRSTIAVLFDQAMASYAEKIGFEELPPER